MSCGVKTPSQHFSFCTLEVISGNEWKSVRKKKEKRKENAGHEVKECIQSYISSNVTVGFHNDLLLCV